MQYIERITKLNIQHYGLNIIKAKLGKISGIHSKIRRILILIKSIEMCFKVKFSNY